MKRFIQYGSIVQFRQVIRAITSSSRYEGEGDNGLPVYNNNPLPTIFASATEKIHGTNASVCFSSPDGLWVQSRKNIITPTKDNAACAFSVEHQRSVWLSLIEALSVAHNINLSKNIISLYFEWAGGNIQKNSACSALSKRAVIFPHFKVSPIEPSEIIPSRWYETKANDKWVDSEENLIFNISNFSTWDVKIDFESPLLSNNEFIEIVEKEIEPNSPLGRKMGVKGNIGEGIVVSFLYKDNLFRFKVKGEKHSRSKVKKLHPVDEELEKKKVDFANYATPAWRLEQAWQTVFGINNEIKDPDIKETGDFLRAVIKDVIKEESDIMADKGLEPKMVNAKISHIARRWFMSELDKESLV